jgi:hypothetical protein
MRKTLATLALAAVVLIAACGDLMTVPEEEGPSLTAVHGEGVPAPKHLYYRLDGGSLEVTWTWGDDRDWDHVSFELVVGGRKIKGEWNIKPYAADPSGDYPEHAFNWTGKGFRKEVPDICVSVMAKNQSGQGQRTTTYHARNCEATPPPVGGILPPFVRPRPETISTGWFHTCGLTTEGQAYCWGYNWVGQLGTGGGHSFTPTAVSGGLVFTQISAGRYHTCGLTTEGQAYCWGYNFHGQLGDGTMTNRSTPTPVYGGLTFMK